MFDKRLIGTWKSDRKRTFASFTFPKKATKQGKRKLKSIFGKFLIKYSRTHCYMVFNGILSKARYKVLAKDNGTVALWNFKTDYGKRQEEIDENLRMFPELCGVGLHISHLHFEGEHYRQQVRLIPSLNEYFRRVPDEVFDKALDKAKRKETKRIAHAKKKKQNA